MSFAKAQVFTILPTLVQNSPVCALSRVDLFFSGVPNIANNKSGIATPGVTIALLPTSNSVPVLDNLSNAPTAYVPYNSVQPTSDASVPTIFRFNPAVSIVTGKPYAICIIPDGDEDFTLWSEVVGANLVGNNGVATSPPAQVGELYDYISPVPLVAGVGVSTNTQQILTGNAVTNTIFANSNYTTASWQADVASCLTFNLYCSRYSVQGNTQLGSFVNPALPTGSQVITGGAVQNTSTGDYQFTIASRRYEYITYDQPTSNGQNVMVGERVYQNTIFWPGGTATPATIAVTNGSSNVVAVSNNINWSTLVNPNGLTPEWIIVYSKNGLGANADQIAVRQITGIISNTVITVDTPIPFSNGVAFFQRGPVAVIDQMKTAAIFGVTSSLMILKDSSANSSLRFTNNTILNVSTSAIGAGYSNSDTLSITGFEAVSGIVIGGYKATANVLTFANGSIQGLFLSNVGCGFTNAAAITGTFLNASGAASNGTGATLVFQVGSLFKTEFLGTTGTGGYFQNCAIINIEAGFLVPRLLVSNPPGTAYSARLYMPYYSTDLPGITSSGKGYFCDNTASADQFDIQSGTSTFYFEFTKRRMTPSWSAELVIPYANGLSCNGAGGDGAQNPTVGLVSNALILTCTGASNCDFASISVNSLSSAITFGRYVINNDYTLENTNYGNAWAKGVESKFNLSTNGYFSESMIGFATAFRPANTDVLWFARLYNSQHDHDSFQQKDWTLLTQSGGNSVFSAPTDFTKKVGLSYTLPPWPNVAFTATGFATTTANSNIITGTGTQWNSNATANIAVNSLVRIYQPLFSNTDYMVSVVTAIANDTSFTIADPVTNNGVIASGLAVDVIAYPHQAFAYMLNSNIARYYDSSMSPHDGYDTGQIKIVMISANGFCVPMVSSIQGVSLSS